MLHSVLKYAKIYSENLLPNVHFKKLLYIINISCGFP